MFKESSRKTSLDPNRESLLKKKDDLKSHLSVFNSKVKDLKKDLHQFKKIMQTSLNQPIPETSATYLSKLTSNFNEIANLFNQIPAKSQQIIQHQAALPKPLKAKASSEIVRTASSRVSRLVARLKEMTSKDPESADRISLLLICEEIYYDLEKFQSYIVSFESSPQSIYSADALLDKIEKNMKLLKGISARYKVKDSVEISEEKFEAPKKDEFKKSKLAQECEKLLSKYYANKDNYSDQDRAEVELLIFKFYDSFSDKDTQKLIDKLLSLKEISKEEKLESKAQVELKKWLGKARHSVSQYLSDKTSNFRLKAYNLAEEMRNELDELMNDLESFFDPSEISNKQKSLSDKLSQIKSEVILLRSVLTGVDLSDDYIKLLREKQLTDYDVKLTDKQKEQVQRLMESRRVRELANISNYRSRFKDRA